MKNGFDGTAVPGPAYPATSSAERRGSSDSPNRASTWSSGTPRSSRVSSSLSEAGIVLPRASLERAWFASSGKSLSMWHQFEKAYGAKADDPAPSAPPVDPPADEPDLKQIAASLESLSASVSALTERVAALEKPDDEDEPEEEPAPEAPCEPDDKALASAVEKAVATAIAARAKDLGL